MNKLSQIPEVYRKDISSTMSHYYVILSDSEESLEPLPDTEIRWKQQRFGLRSLITVSFLPINPVLEPRSEGFFGFASE